MKKYDCIIPVHRPTSDLTRLLRSLDSQTIKPQRVVLVESVDEGASKYDLMDYIPGGMDLSIKLLAIPTSRFDHAATRNLAVAQGDSPIFVCMTQDAVPEDTHTMEALIAPLGKDRIALSYARQLPRPEASIEERITRSFNYPEEAMVKSREDIDRLGIKACFCSNVCCAYIRRVFNQLEGFEPPALFNEDMVYAMSLLKRGGRIAYTPSARVFHSHEHSLVQDFKRSYLLGISQGMHPEVFKGLSSESEGIHYVRTVIKALADYKRPYRIPGFVVHCAARFTGYRLGCMRGACRR